MNQIDNLNTFLKHGKKPIKLLSIVGSIVKFGLENVDSSMNASVVLLNSLFGFFSFDMKIDDFMILKERMCHLIVHIDFKLSVK